MPCLRDGYTHSGLGEPIVYLFYKTHHQTRIITSIGSTIHITMDKETVIVKSEPDMFVVVKEETVDLTEESGYESLISFDSESQIDDAEKCHKNDGLDTTHVKSSLIISEGINSNVDGEKFKLKDGDISKKGETVNPLAGLLPPLLPPIPLPYMTPAIPWGMYPSSSYLPYPCYQLPFPMHNLPHMFRHIPHLDTNGKITKDTSFHHIDSSTQNVEKRPICKVKNRSQTASTPYNRTESNARQVVSSDLNINSSSLRTDSHDDPTRPFKCTECGRGFAKKYYLSVHMRIHTGERSYKCSQCSKAFRQRNSLVVHQRLHNPNRPFECSLCDMRFTSKSEVKRHFRTHIPEKTGDINYNELRR